MSAARNGNVEVVRFLLDHEVRQHLYMHAIDAIAESKRYSWTRLQGASPRACMSPMYLACQVSVEERGALEPVHACRLTLGAETVPCVFPAWRVIIRKHCVCVCTYMQANIWLGNRTGLPTVPM